MESFEIKVLLIQSSLYVYWIVVTKSKLMVELVQYIDLDTLNSTVTQTGASVSIIPKTFTLSTYCIVADANGVYLIRDRVILIYTKDSDEWNVNAASFSDIIDERSVVVTCAFNEYQKAIYMFYV